MFIGEQDSTQASFDALVDGLTGLPVEEGKGQVTNWPILTLLPFIAAPDRCIFVRPEVTKGCAARIRWDIQYQSSLNWATYRLVCEMSRYLLTQLKDLGARDLIDVQSFIWVIGRYPG